VDVGGFAEPRKILCQCALPAVEQLSVHPRSAHGGAGIPQQKGRYHQARSLVSVSIVPSEINDNSCNEQ
jgi:hypothetical protein